MTTIPHHLKINGDFNTNELNVFISRTHLVYLFLKFFLLIKIELSFKIFVVINSS